LSLALERAPDVREPEEEEEEELDLYQILEKGFCVCARVAASLNASQVLAALCCWRVLTYADVC
jgi:hypothetical protein